MTEFPLNIVTPDGKIFSGNAESLRVRSIDGDICIRARHTDYVTALGMGAAEVIIAGEKHIAACMGGVISVLDGDVTLAATVATPRRSGRVICSVTTTLPILSLLWRKLA